MRPGRCPKSDRYLGQLGSQTMTIIRRPVGRQSTRSLCHAQWTCTTDLDSLQIHPTPSETTDYMSQYKSCLLDDIAWLSPTLNLNPT